MKQYRTHEAFRDALPAHLERRSKQLDVPVELLRRRLVFQRFLARLLRAAPDRWVLSGGAALDWRLSRSHTARTRTTVDLDFLYRATVDQASADLAAAAATDLDDHFTFTANLSPRTAEEAARAFRFHLTASIGPRPYLMFVVDIGIVDPLEWPPEQMVIADPLDERGGGLTVPTLPLAHQIAEKVHAITRLTREGKPRTRVVQDVADLVLIATTERLAAAELRAALVAVFRAYNTHSLPAAMPSTPTEWARDYRVAAQELGIPPELERADAIVSGLLSGVLTDTARGTWDPTMLRWREST